MNEKYDSYLFIDSADGTRALLNFGGKYYYEQNDTRAGSEILLPLIDGLLSRAECRLSDIEIFGACVGPGSFTGLRIGLTTVKTFCYSLDKPCFAVNNLRLNSYNNKSKRVISVTDAGNKVCYVARYDGDEELDAAKCVTADDLRAFIAENPDFSVSSDKKLSALFGGTVGIGEREMKLAAQKHMGNAISQKELLPLYIRKAQPERGEGDL